MKQDNFLDYRLLKHTATIADSTTVHIMLATSTIESIRQLSGATIHLSIFSSDVNNINLDGRVYVSSDSPVINVAAYILSRLSRVTHTHTNV